MYNIYKNIFFTKGVNRTLVFDSLIGEVYFIPNEVFNIILEKKYSIDKTEVGEEIFNFFKEKNLLFEVESKISDNFIDVNNDFEIPYDIMYIVVELSEITAKNLYKFNFESVNGKVGQFNFIFNGHSSVESIDLMIDFANKNECDTIECTVYKDFNHFDYLSKVIDSLEKNIIISTLRTDIEKEKLFSSVKIGRFWRDTSLLHLKVSPNLLTYFESFEHHVFFNRKIVIDRFSNIKKSTESEDLFGKIDSMDRICLEDIINQPNFKELWNIKKEHTLICEDCEFRRLCVDTRIPYKIDNRWTHSTECEYNPYISKWNFEEDYLSLKDCGVESVNGELLIDREKLDLINNRLWFENA